LHGKDLVQALRPLLGQRLASISAPPRLGRSRTPQQPRTSETRQLRGRKASAERSLVRHGIVAQRLDERIRALLGKRRLRGRRS
jgi:hypothetical protein